MSDTELIDWEQLSMIFGEDEEEFDEEMADLYQEFLDDAASRLGALREACLVGEKSLIAKESHKLKGSASNFGFAAMAATLGRMENEIERLSSECLADELASAEDAFKASRESVIAKFPDLDT